MNSLPSKHSFANWLKWFLNQRVTDDLLEACSAIGSPVIALVILLKLWSVSTMSLAKTQGAINPVAVWQELYAMLAADDTAQKTHNTKATLSNTAGKY